MSHQIDYLPVATSAGANVDTQANFQGSGYQTTGFQVGVADPRQFNKLARQSSMIAAAVANFIANMLNGDVYDDGNLAQLITNFTNAVMQAASNSRNRIASIPYSTTPVFDATQADTFEMVLTGDVTGSTLINVSPGQTIRFLIKQDGVGGHLFAPPVGGMADVSPTPNATSVQVFLVDNTVNVFPTGPMTTL